MGTWSFQVVKYGRGVLLTTHPLLVPRSWKSRAIPLPTLRLKTGPVTGKLCLTLYIKRLSTEYVASHDYLHQSILFERYIEHHCYIFCRYPEADRRTVEI